MFRIKDSVYIIAEVGVNHNGDEGLLRELVDVAAAGGADAVKFQLFTPELLCSSVYRKSEIEMLHKYVMPLDLMFRVKEYVASKNLDFIITPFDYESFEDVVKLGSDPIKIASGELTHTPFLEKAAKAGKDLIISTGASYLSDVERAVELVRKHNRINRIALLHCTSTYPAPDNSLNLNAITTLKYAFPDCIIGYSDHSLGITAAAMAVVLGARIIEKHITLDKKLAGPDHMASADKFEFFEMVKSIRTAEIMLGTGMKVPQKCEGNIGRCIVAKRDLGQGEIISYDSIDFKRSGIGIKPYDYDKVVGARLIKPVAENEMITWEHILTGC